MSKHMTKASIDEIRSRRRRGQSYETIAREMHVGVATAHRYGHDVDSTTIELPGLNNEDPERRVAVSISAEDFARLPGGSRTEAVFTAAMVTQDSLKKRLLRTICETGPFSGLDELMAAVREPKDNFGGHEVMHLLHSLNKDGSVTFKSKFRGTASARLSDIRASNKGYDRAGIPIPGKSRENARGGHVSGTNRAGHAVGKDMTEARNHGPFAKGGPVERIAAPPLRLEQAAAEPQVVRQPDPVPEVTPVTPEPDYPLLSALLAAWESRSAADAKAARFVEAAALLEGDDPEEAERLLAKAATLAPTPFTPLEQEYLRYYEDTH